jgi:hypothetical protein
VSQGGEIVNAKPCFVEVQASDYLQRPCLPGKTMDEMKFVLTLALILTFSPRRRNSFCASLFYRQSVRPIPPQVFQRDGGHFSLSTNGVGGEGRGEVVRECMTLDFGLRASDFKLFP